MGRDKQQHDGPHGEGQQSLARQFRRPCQICTYQILLKRLLDLNDFKNLYDKYNVVIY